jgi:putative ABC transport system permease protein
MREVFAQVFSNLRANKLRTFLTMFGILWGVISVVVLSATGEGFRAAISTCCEELGKNIAIVWGCRTSLQAGGSAPAARSFSRSTTRGAGARVDDDRRRQPGDAARAEREERLQRRALGVTGIEPQYQAIRTLDIEHGRTFRFTDNEGALRVAISAPTPRSSCSRTRDAIGSGRAERRPYTVIGTIRKKDQDSNYSGPTTTRCSCRLPRWRATFRGSASIRRLSRHHRRAEAVGRCAIPRSSTAHRPHRGHRLAARARGPPDSRAPPRLRSRRPRAIDVWDTSLESLMFERMIAR